MLKKGQFFLIAALLISGITIGFGTIYNEARIERSDSQVYDLSEELHSELQQSYDSGVINTQNENQIQGNIQTLTSYYAEQNPDSEFEVIFGDENSLKKISTLEGQASEPVSITDADYSNQETSVKKTEKDVTLCMNFKENKKLESTDKKVCKDFKIQKGQNFYLVVKKKVKNEQVVIYR